VRAAPQTWHHGLIARWWAEFNTDGEDIERFRALVEQHGEPALDLGCGTGRLLVPMLAAGLDVDGCDVSADMLAHCRARATAEGLAPRLLEQPMHALEAPRTYRTIFICGSFGISGDRGHDLDTLRRAYHHLEPGGVLAFDLYVPNVNSRSWQTWLPEHRPELPAPWPDRGDRRTSTDGTALELHARLLEFDPLALTLIREIRATHWKDGEQIAQEQASIRINIYFAPEVRLMLETAGFADVKVHGGLSDREAEPYRDAHLMFIATK
jgi:SAM-dependent methyltransferase